MLRAAINRNRVDDALAGTREGQQRGHDRGHAGVEYERRMRAGFERDDLIFENFGVGMIEARVNQIWFFARLRMRAASHDIEGALGSFGTGKDVSRTAKD